MIGKQDVLLGNHIVHDFEEVNMVFSLQRKMLEVIGLWKDM